ncbi:pentatricopeptide repeat-containing protein, chloroplastic [Iris pallida]|nr:pentatricopeptide repeat-containing protein, chloroplastic [Iris pallida]
MKEAATTVDDMERHGLSPSFVIYNDIIHGFAREKEFDKSRATLDKMVENGLLPTPETYNGLIRAYGNYGLYDEMSKCVKKMESEGCFPNEVTYNVLIGELARAGLFERMERVYRTLLSKKMNLQPHTLVTMLEAYADLGILDKMEKVYRKVLNSKAFMKESLSRKLAMVYIENCRFARLEEFGNELGAKLGRTDLVWCILLLSSACLSSRKGIESLVVEMEAAKVEFNINFTNVLGLFYLKFKDFKALDYVFSRIGTHNSKPDMVTFGILFDACKIGYSGTWVIEVWRQNGYLESLVEMNTDPLVLAAFGKGYFIKNCEKLYSSLHYEAKEKKPWSYGDLINLVFGNK